MPAPFVKAAGSALALLLLLAPLAQAGETRKITTLEGERVDVPVNPGRIACFYHPAYDKIAMLSRGSRIALMPREASPWAYRFYPELKGVPTAAAGTVPDVERLLKLKVDLVIYPKGHYDVSRIKQAGIAAICPFNNDFVPSSPDRFNQEFKRQILFFGELLGSDARIRAESYCRYFDSIMTRVQAITSRIPESSKPKVYYGKATDLCSTQGSNTNMRWYTELAGGIYLPRQLPRYFAQVNLESILAWNPDIVLLGSYGAFNTPQRDFPAKTIKAYRTGRIYRIPAGAFYWDMTSCETALLPLFLAKKFHPALFKDWDLVQEMRKFYAEIYHIRLSPQDAERILNGLGPV
ncbi:ABC transporter substrate-binding protein [Holophaga foetida]|uniref:ABC transporter substrate-binding protein n=1 Tax=Holophaga foetida TaxID=35839 RepID=UPI0002473EF4|nr:ABC transporter substrate-binding protein [Holophaga foetida]